MAAPATGVGQALPTGLRAKMEHAFGADFSAVRIHEGGGAAAMGALAYTRGSEIHFAPGRYQPQSQSGQELLGHELAHVVQQSQGRVRATAQAKGAAINDDAGLEREADEMGARAARGERVSGAPAAGALAVAHGDDGAMQFTRYVKQVVPGEAVLTSHKSTQWMVVQGLGGVGFAQWHLSIFPSGQQSWTGAYKLPANGKRGIAPWMTFEEFHLTSPEGVHFFYTDSCVPKLASDESSGKSPPWSNKAAWATANQVCAAYFGISVDWLEQQIAAQIAQDKDDKIEQVHQERMWKLYMNFVKQHPEWYEKTKMSFEDYVHQIESGFRGTHQEFREHARLEWEARGGQMPVYEKRTWRDDGDGVFGYQDIARQ